MALPRRYPENVQLFKPTPEYPYPNNFTDAPNFGKQILIHYNGQTMLQGLNPVMGPVSFPVRNPYANVPIRSDSVYPMKNCRACFPPMDAYNVLDGYQMQFLTYGYYPKNYASYGNIPY